MRVEGVLGSTWWFGRCALTGCPEYRKGPSREWEKMCILIFIYSMHRKPQFYLLNFVISVV
jgi:hypothetical protein